jgi:protein-tyrosine phosphatase
MLGNLKLPLYFGSHYMVWGGPYLERPQGMVSVKLAREINAPADLELPIKDFSTPEQAATDAVMRVAVAFILRGEPLYAGCMGGRGRTGLFLSLLAKAFGVRSPVQYVRANYYEHAVETVQQMEFVRDYQIPLDVQKAVRRAKWRSLFSFGRNMTVYNGVFAQAA